jgi:hypothetical protein
LSGKLSCEDISSISRLKILAVDDTNIEIVDISNIKRE